MVTEAKIPHTHEDLLFADLGCVIIGRNEGKRLEMALKSIPSSLLNKSVYVDSGSTDGSQKLALEKGLTVIQLNTNKPFTAARARNTGAQELIKKYPTIKYIQFFDGDCSLAHGWLETAVQFLNQNPDIAVVCGRRKERFPEQTIYNWLCDIEWNTPVGYANTCGGDFLIRAFVFKDVKGLTNELIAGEEPDMCFRIREIGHKIYRLGLTMTYHDADIHSFDQWFKRAKRSGYAFAEAVYRYRKNPNGYWRRELLRIFLWGILLPLISTVSVIFFGPEFFLLLILYPLQIIRIGIRSDNLRHRWLYGFFMVLSKFPESIGVISFITNSLMKKTTLIIEYK